MAMIQLTRLLGALWLSGSVTIGAMAVSAYFFANVRDGGQRGKVVLHWRIVMVMFWPLALFSREGRAFLGKTLKGQF